LRLFKPASGVLGASSVVISIVGGGNFSSSAEPFCENIDAFGAAACRYICRMIAAVVGQRRGDQLRSDSEIATIEV